MNRAAVAALHVKPTGPSGPAGPSGAPRPPSARRAATRSLGRAAVPARRRLRWVLRHAIVRATMQQAARKGSVAATLFSDQGVVAEPWAAYDHVRDQGRLVRQGPARVTNHHDLCVLVLRSPDFGVIGGHGGHTPPLLRRLTAIAGAGPVGPIEPPALLAVDAPDHTRMRKLVVRAFTAKAVAQLRTRTREIAAELLDEMAARAARGEPVDLVRDYASLLPATVIAEMLGAPVAMRRQFLDWGAGAALCLDPGLSYPDFRRSERDLAALERWMRRHFRAIRESPGDDIFSDLVRAQVEKEALTDEELLSVAMLLLAAGFETTVNLISNASVLLLEHPDQLELLREQPSYWANAVDEVLRMESPVQRTARVAHRDVEIGGVHVTQGTIVICGIGAAGRDPAVFDDPHTLDVTRANADQHLAFSSGAHYCLGAALARMEGEVALQALFDRFPRLALSGPPVRRPTRVLRGYDALPVTLGTPVLTVV